MNLDTIPRKVKDLLQTQTEKRTQSQEPRVFVISDTHFFHKNINKYEPIRTQFNDCEQTMINNWKRVVRPQDIVYHLGDVAFGLKKNQEKLRSVLSQLPGYKILIRGNHDDERVNFIDLGFDEVKEHEIIDDLYLNHYPLVESIYDDAKLKKLKKSRLSLCNEFEISTVIHGHVHSNRVKGTSIPHFNCSVENINFTPILLTDAERQAQANVCTDFKFDF